MHSVFMMINYKSIEYANYVHRLQFINAMDKFLN